MAVILANVVTLLLSGWGVYLVITDIGWSPSPHSGAWMTRATWRQNNLKPKTTLEIKTQPSASLCRQRIDTCNFQIIDVQKKMIRDQNFMILDLNEKIREIEIYSPMAEV